MLNQAMQIIGIRASAWDIFRAKATIYEKRDGIWHIINDNIAAVIGKNGLGWGAGIEPELYAFAPYAPKKIEGDARSPAGIFPLKRSFGFLDAASCTGLEYIRIGPGVECVDDIASCYYNRIVDRTKIGHIDWQSSERCIH
jgi:L,D-peptidoglycan transpeptidase YkuD (ErfK/YbiS/YcfS/YnhG family)